MRRALMGLLLAATMATPVAAQAQEVDESDRRAVRQERQAQRQAERPERQAERQERRIERQAERPERQERRTERQSRGEASFGSPAAERQDRRTERLERRSEGRASGAAAGMNDPFRAGAEAGAAQQRAQQEQVLQQRQERQQREGRQERAGRYPGSIYPDAWQGDRNNPRLERMRRHYEQNERNAQREDRREWRQENREDRRDARQDNREDRRERRQDNRGDRRDWQNNRSYDNDWQDRRDDRREWRQDRRETRRDWNRNWRNDSRYDWQRYRYSNRNLYRPGRYYSPYRGHSYSRFSIGVFLEPLFFSSRYRIMDPWQYRLPPAYPGTQWVRYYDDVLLVDTYSGEVIDVIYDFFW